MTNARVSAVSIFFGLFSMLLIARLFYWQVVKAQELSQQARYQHESGSTIIAPRGNILAQDETWLAASEDAWLVTVMKTEVKNTKELVYSLAPLLVENPDDRDQVTGEIQRIETLLKSSPSIWIPLKHKVSSERKKKIEELELAGVSFEREEKRTYPEGSSSAQLLGFVGKQDDGSDKGYFGLEGYYDRVLLGNHGFVHREADAFGSPLVFGDSKEISAREGVDLKTHIDKRVQLVIEEKLKEGLSKYGAKSGSIIVMDPQTGGILGMTSNPSYDPAKYFDYGDEFFKNPVISDAFEPGSVFKPIIMAAGLDSGVISPGTQCDICHGRYQVDKYFIETWDKKYYPNSTMTEVLLHSDNVGMTFIGNLLGVDKMYDYISKFGFGRLTGIDLQGESTPALRKKGTWNIVDQATTTFGQGIAVTPMQMLKAIAIIANRGRDIKPQVVDQLKVDDWEEDIQPEIGEQVISTKAAQEVTEMMIAAVKQGEAKWAVPKGFKVAGKTGTAQIPVAGHYDAEKTNASFVGFAPVDNPKFVMLVTLREPQSSQWASETAAPLWFSIARDLFPYLGIQPEN